MVTKVFPLGLSSHLSKSPGSVHVAFLLGLLRDLGLYLSVKIDMFLPIGAALPLFSPHPHPDTWAC